MSHLLECSQIGKSYFGVSVLRGVNLSLAAGSVLGLVGENGAGKSTLMNILGGVTQPDAGQMKFDGAAYRPQTPAEATRRGVAFVHQELNLFTNLSIAEKAIAAYPGAWQGKNYRDILAVLGYDIHKPWHKLSKKDRQWILFTEEKPVVTVYAEREAHRIQRPYQGTYMSAAVYVRHTFSTTNSAVLRKRVEQFMVKSDCLSCHGKRLRAESLSVKFGGYDIAELSHMPLGELAKVLAGAATSAAKHDVAELIVHDLKFARHVLARGDYQNKGARVGMRPLGVIPFGLGLASSPRAKRAWRVSSCAPSSSPRATSTARPRSTQAPTDSAAASTS